MSSSGGESVMRRTLEKNLQYRPLTMEEREVMEKDVRQLKKVLKTQENNLKKLRSDNRSSMAIAVVLLICTFFFYGVYHMMFRQP
ncbi:hypothetical protein Ocin01_16683 [Orchesella cincta]|uniref:Coiled-coil domain-containing protein 167 n=1 Tax=Orchesella cincta TaxID=48709 RepID=A0A1D2MAJ8_ORCCI|nr:hypothetical protein Ocin01_16683 [Orchesella cincta]